MSFGDKPKPSKTSMKCDEKQDAVYNWFLKKSQYYKKKLTKNWEDSYKFWQSQNFLGLCTMIFSKKTASFLVVIEIVWKPNFMQKYQIFKVVGPELTYGCTHVKD